MGTGHPFQTSAPPGDCGSSGEPLHQFQPQTPVIPVPAAKTGAEHEEMLSEEEEGEDSRPAASSAGAPAQQADLENDSRLNRNYGQDHHRHDLPQESGSNLVEPRGGSGSSSEARAGGVEMIIVDVEPLHQHLPQASLGGEHREILSEEEEDFRRATTSPPSNTGDARAGGVEMVITVEPLHQHLPQASQGGEHGEIVSEEEEDSRRATTSPPRSPNLRTVTSEKNWVMLLSMSCHPKCAKWAYAALFLGGIMFALSSRDFEVATFSETDRVHGCEHARYCLSAEGALRISLAFFLFFTFMFATTVWTKKVHERRNIWHSNLGVQLLIKIALVIGCMYLVQVPPPPFIHLYGNVARAGAGLFLAIQLISVTRFIMWLNEWHRLNPEKWRWLVQGAAIFSNLGSFGVILWLVYEHKSNIVDITVVGVTLVLMLLMVCIHLKSGVTEGWLAPGIMMAYIVFMCWTVLKSEPHREFTEAEHPKGSDWLTITSFVLGVIVTAYSTLSTGEDHEWLQFNEEVPSEDDIPYGFGYFHLVFALGSMYFGMLLVGWNANETMERWTIDMGWWSAVVRIINGLLAAVLYIWMLRTPSIWNKKKLVLSRSGASLVPHVTFI